MATVTPVKAAMHTPMAKNVPLRMTCRALACGLLCGAGALQAQELDPAARTEPALSIVPRVSMVQTFTDNVNLSAVDKQADQITEISPGIHINSSGGHLKGYFDYALRGIAYGQGSQPGAYQNALDTAGVLEAVDRTLYVDFGGAISQQSISAFAPQSSAGSYSNVNKTEVASYRVSPYLRGRLGGQGEYLVRLARAITQSDVSGASLVATSDALVSLDSNRLWGNLGVVADASRKGIDYSTGRYTETDLVNLGLSYAAFPQLRVVVKGGQEASNYASADKQSYATSDLLVNWTPSEHAQVSASWGNRSFGETHAFSLEHRTALTRIRFADSRDLSAVPGAVAGLGSAQGTLPSGVNNFLTSALSLQRRQDLSIALLGVRSTLEVIASQSDVSRLDTFSSAVDDLVRASLRQSGVIVNLERRLTAATTLRLSAQQQLTTGSANQQDSWLNQVSLSLSTQVGSQTTLGMGLRRTVYSGLSAYDESACLFNLTLAF